MLEIQDRFKDYFSYLENVQLNGKNYENRTKG